ncbi:undecaprenyl-diphosphatase UppP [Candidatus Falkowbacteria bacterium RIFOXYB2_FULL_47_14]|uniref:Undecaprenyl-diphosphatase n=1 Tax=Candidatus Falkowbacteria bacterium RIFOXYA2_FULL_47_19 TaxID=1797994 RepID=A0A1F5SM47_9BACT|nr:MAG: undecaprenyl-diphosphatase UppP [Candidatus Falkowbacteria bacterium RIFOXYA2_FULL_47_19]OGF36279.1 MAG: undecaprenyl-diphosphatase UppP [Candidatus Falkowbacteria bacterium RIFOXYC2_FULL_46_15]OGF43083.1 MAG: undecaprenyl-diphosphatase UppP [Candidatus Falkowbacteria bacterium RIFOXYB2_FULL_47_14]
MMYINAIIFGIVQGITEFLPVSSSGHLVVLHELIALPIDNEAVFDVTLHLATLFAVIYFLRVEVWRLITGWIRSLGGEKNDDGRLAWLIILATIPAALVGAVFDDYIENVLRSPWLVIVMLTVVGSLFIIFEKYSRRVKEYTALNARQVFFIGCAQALALIPGTSRSGITIIAGLGAGLQREASIRFSFILSIPIIAGAAVKKIPHLFNAGLNESESTVLAIAFVFAFFTAVLVIKYFLRFARNHSLNIFAFYRFILAAILIVYFWP